MQKDGKDQGGRTRLKVSSTSEINVNERREPNLPCRDDGLKVREQSTLYLPKQ
jgi:hypothetical protein